MKFKRRAPKLVLDSEGIRWAKTKGSLAKIFGVSVGCISQYYFQEGFPEKNPDKGFKIQDICAYILSKNPSPNVADKVTAVMLSEGEEYDESQDIDDLNRETLSRQLNYKSRIDRARALKLEHEVAREKKDLIHFKVFEEFFADIIPYCISELRRQLESVLPALEEGMTAAQIRKIHREHIDKVLNSFHDRAMKFSDGLKSERIKKTNGSKLESDPGNSSQQRREITPAGKD